MDPLQEKRFILAKLQMEQSDMGKVIEFSPKSIEANPFLMHKHRKRFAHIQGQIRQLKSSLLPDIIA